MCINTHILRKFENRKSCVIREVKCCCCLLFLGRIFWIQRWAHFTKLKKGKLVWSTSKVKNGSEWLEIFCGWKAKLEIGTLKTDTISGLFQLYVKGLKEANDWKFFTKLKKPNLYDPRQRRSGNFWGWKAKVETPRPSVHPQESNMNMSNGPKNDHRLKTM